MNDDIISLPNGDFEVRRRGSIKAILKKKLNNIRPMDEYLIGRSYATCSELGNTILVGDKCCFVFIQSPLPEPIDSKLIQPDWPGFSRKLCIVLEREIEYYDLNYELTSDSNSDHAMIVIQKSI